MSDIDRTEMIRVMDSLAQAKGDIPVAADAGSFSRFPVGTDGQVIKANSAEELGVEWGDVEVPTKESIGLGNVDNTADAIKPVSVPQQDALDLKADLADLPTYVDVPLCIVTAGNFGAQTTTYQPFGSGISNSTDAPGAGANVAHAAGLVGTIIGMIISTRSNTLNDVTGAEFRLWVNGATTDVVCALALATTYFEDLVHTKALVKTDKVQIRYVNTAGGGTFVVPSITLILRRTLA